MTASPSAATNANDDGRAPPAGRDDRESGRRAGEETLADLGDVQGGHRGRVGDRGGPNARATGHATRARRCSRLSYTARVVSITAAGRTRAGPWRAPPRRVCGGARHRWPAHRSRRRAHRRHLRARASGAPVVDHLPAAADARGHDRHAHRRRLHGRTGKALAVRRQHVDVHGRVQRLDVVAQAQERDAVAPGPVDVGITDGVGLVRVAGPITTIRTWGSVARRRAAAAKTSRYPFSHTSRPTNPHTTSSGPAPISARSAACAHPSHETGRSGRGRCRCPADGASDAGTPRWARTSTSSGFWTSSACEQLAATRRVCTRRLAGPTCPRRGAEPCTVLTITGTRAARAARRP